MSKILVVFGATGQQGSSVVNHVLNSPELSNEFKVRALSRDANSEKSNQLKEKNVEVVPCDITDRSTVKEALKGAHTVFLMTTPSFAASSTEAHQWEYDNGKLVADVAIEEGVEFLIFSTLPSVRDVSAGKYTKVTPFDAKADIEKYIRGLPIKSAFYAPGFFMENLQGQPFLGPRLTADGTYVMARNTSPITKLPFIDAVLDTGKFIGTILEEPDKFEGKTFCAAQGLYTLVEVAEALAKNTGKEIVYKHISNEEFLASVPIAAEIFMEGFAYADEYGGYYGPDSEKLVAWAAENVHGNLRSLEKFLEAHPLQLE